jgi:hypothetical protein
MWYIVLSRSLPEQEKNMNLLSEDQSNCKDHLP